MIHDQCQRLKQGRINAHLSQEEAADRLNVSVRTYQKWEQGEAFPGSVETLIRIATLFSMSLDWWLTGKGMKPLSTTQRQIVNGIHGLRPDQLEALNVIIASMVGV